MEGSDEQGGKQSRGSREYRVTSTPGAALGRGIQGVNSGVSSVGKLHSKDRAPEDGAQVLYAERHDPTLALSEHHRE